MTQLILGYKASAEQFGPRELVELGVPLEEARPGQRHGQRSFPAVAAQGRSCAVLAGLDGRGG